MSKNSAATKPQNETAASSAPVAATPAADSVKGNISAAKEPAAKPEKPSYVVNETLQKSLLAMDDDVLVAKAAEVLKDVEKNDTRIFQIHPDNPDLKDDIVGSPLERSGIRAAVITFLRSRKDEKASGAVISAYMHLAAGESGKGCYKGKYDLGYLAPRGLDVNRGMTARKQLRILAAPTPTKEG